MKRSVIELYVAHSSKSFNGECRIREMKQSVIELCTAHSETKINNTVL
ncbi:hypothetical protein [Eubacterium ventriosum]|nr:hypothetical protein [Eubacterium ventriosum]